MWGLRRFGSPSKAVAAVLARVEGLRQVDLEARKLSKAAKVSAAGSDVLPFLHLPEMPVKGITT